MNEEQAKEAKRAQVPVRIRALSMMMLEEIEYKRILCILPLREGEEVPVAVLEDRCGHSVSYAKISQIIAKNSQIIEKSEDSVPAAACV